MAMTEDSGDVTIDADYEFAAPKFFDFIEGETDDQIREAQLWFETALTYAPSPIMHKIKTTRACQLDTICDFTETSEKESVPSESTQSLENMKNIDLEPEKQSAKAQQDPASSKEDVTLNVAIDQPKTEKTICPSKGAEECTPKPPMASERNMLQTQFKKQQTARRIASALKNPSALKLKNQPT